MSKVGLKESEYSTLKLEIKEAHETVICLMDTTVKQMKALNQTGGGFYVKELTPKVNAVLEELEAISSRMESAYEVHETIIDSFQTSIENYDTCG